MCFSVTGLNFVTNCISVSKPESEVKDTQEVLVSVKMKSVRICIIFRGQKYLSFEFQLKSNILHKSG